MLEHGLLGILLHARVNGRENTQSVRVDIVVLTVALLVLVTPSEQRIVIPSHRVDQELIAVPRRIVTHVRLLGHHVLTDKLPEVHGNTVLVRAAVEIQLKRLRAGGVVLGLADVAGVEHLAQHHIAALLTTLRIAHRIKVRRILAHADERG